INTVVGTGQLGFAGDNGPALSATLSDVWALTIDSKGSLFMADCNNRRVRKVSGGTITTIAGSGKPSQADYAGDGGPATSAVLNGPKGVAVDTAGNLIIADTDN